MLKIPNSLKGENIPKIVHVHLQLQKILRNGNFNVPSLKQLIQSLGIGKPQKSDFLSGRTTKAFTPPPSRLVVIGFFGNFLGGF